MTASTEVLREELQAAETALADRRSQLNFARLLAEKNTLKAHGYQGELQLEQQQTAELEAAAVGLTEVAQELHMSELLCAEARDSAEDALLIRRQAVSAAQVLLQAHALLSSGRCSKARALEDAQEASEAYLWRRDALRFEEQRAQQLRRVLRSESEASEAALHEYRNLRAQRDNYLHPQDLAEAKPSRLLDEAEILQNQLLEMTLGLDLWRRMRKAEAEIKTPPGSRKVMSRNSAPESSSEVLPRNSLISVSSSKASTSEEKHSSRRSSNSQKRLSEVAQRLDPRRTPAELRCLAQEIQEGEGPSAVLLEEQRSNRSSEMSAAAMSGAKVPLDAQRGSEGTPNRSSGTAVTVTPRLSIVQTQGSIANRASQSEVLGADANLEASGAQVLQVKDECRDVAEEVTTSPAKVPLDDRNPADPAAPAAPAASPSSPSQKSSLSYSSRGIPSASQTRAAERSPRSPSSPATSSSPTSPKKLPFKPSSPCPRLITKHPPSGFDLRPPAAAAALGALKTSPTEVHQVHLHFERRNATTSSPSQASQVE